ncbi:MAG TPA: hypothetical protein VJ123_02545 [Anaerolineales bacterium]|nr:hypothetical protein [Anaerolineales bacterium]
MTSPAKRAQLSSLQCWIPLFLISSLSLFIELAVIRWVAGEVRLFSYFKNFSLLAAFLGLAIGFALVGKGRDYRPSIAPLLLVFVGLVAISARLSGGRYLPYPGGDEFLWYASSASYWVSLLLFLVIVLIFFLIILLLFIPLGQATGEEMAAHAPIPAYVVNILASLIGVWAFSLLSTLQTPPVVWFGLAALGLGAYLAKRQILTRGRLALLVAALMVLALTNDQAVWSPYQRLKVSPFYLPRQDGKSAVQMGYELDVQHILYMRAIDLSARSVADLEQEMPELAQVAFSYNLPYQLLPQGSRVLIVGAGMGNDVAAALRNGVAQVDAVEIDPAILAFGQRLHPERPYDDPRVRAIVADARSFFNRASHRYDAVVFGLLDSHTLLSGLSSVRLDSFVYTLESFEQVRQHLNPHGIVSVTFAVSPTAPWLEERLGRMLVAVFGPQAVFAHRGGPGTTFVAGLLSEEQSGAAQLRPWRPDPTLDGLALPTDDWPYLYLHAPKIPAAYWQAILVIAVACLALMARSFPAALRPDWHFWLLGAAFLLVEVKSVTEFALLFGTTWLVNALAISGVLLMVLLANAFVLRWPRVRTTPVYLLLFFTLVGLYFLPLDRLSGLPELTKALVSMSLLSFPLFFAGLIFADSLRRAGETSRPLASNLSGTLMGGLLEYGSLIWGIKTLYLIAFALYTGAWLAARRGPGGRGG